MRNYTCKSLGLWCAMMLVLSRYVDNPRDTLGLPITGHPPLLVWQLVSRIFGQISANCRIILVSPAAALQLTPVPHSQDKWYQANCYLSHWSGGSHSSLLLVDICGQIISDLSPLDYLWIMSVRSVCLVPPALWKIISPQTTQVRAKFVKIDRKFYADSI